MLNDNYDISEIKALTELSEKWNSSIVKCKCLINNKNKWFKITLLLLRYI